MNTLKKWSTSIVAIVLAFWIFFPLGFILIYLRLKNRNGKYYAITKELLWTGIVWGGFGIFYLGITLTEPTFFSEELPAGLFMFVLPGAICFYFGHKRNKKMKIYDKYMSYISSRKKIKIDGLCDSVGVSYDVALKMLEEMISKGFIAGYIEDDELIMKKNEGIDQEIIEQTQKNRQTKVVKCKECGAKNTITTGETKECEYCGTILQ